MKYVTGHSSNMDFFCAVEEATRELHNPKVIIYTSTLELFPDITKEIQSRYPECVTAGVTSYITFTEAGNLQDTLSVFAIEGECEFAGGVMEDAIRHPMQYADDILACKNKLSDCENTICLTFTVAYRQCEEIIQVTLKKILGDLPVIGTSAGNTGSEVTYIAFNGSIYDKGCVYLFLKNLTGKIAFVRENIYKPTRHTVLATDVDVERRIVYEYDRRPATEVMMKLLHTDEQGLPDALRQHPMGRVVDDDIYITDFKEIVEDTAIAYYARIYGNTGLYLLSMGDYCAVFEDTINRLKEQVAMSTGGIVINCAGRAMFYQERGWMQGFAEQLRVYMNQFFVCSGYGEQMEGQHFNQTMMIIAFE